MHDIFVKLHMFPAYTEMHSKHLIKKYNYNVKPKCGGSGSYTFSLFSQTISLEVTFNCLSKYAPNALSFKDFWLNSSDMVFAEN